MVAYKKWCGCIDSKVKAQALRILTSQAAKLDRAVALVAAKVPIHYAAEERLSNILERLGKAKAAKFLREKLPQSDKIRSGDLGEILASEYVDELTGYALPIKRLRWKDHREMSMRGDDLIGVKAKKGAPLEFLKGEIKSRVSLTTAVVKEAREALRGYNGRPSPHALSFVADRLHQNGENALADAIDDAQLKKGIKSAQVEHLLFTFSGNNPQDFLETDLKNYGGSIRQNGVGLQVAGHKAFVKAVYEKVIADGNDD